MNIISVMIILINIIMHFYKLEMKNIYILVRQNYIYIMKSKYIIVLLIRTFKL